MARRKARCKRLLIAHVQLLSVHFLGFVEKVDMMALFSVLLLIASTQVAISKPYDVAVTDIGRNSVTIHWKTTEKSTKIDSFRIHCNGTRRYISMDGQHLLETEERVQYAPSGKDHVLIGDLQANYNYSCSIQEGISPQTPILYGEVSDPCHFTTDYGEPEEPMAPEIQLIRRNRSIKVILFSTSTRFGPISGYQVQFHLVGSKTIDGTPLIDDEVYEPFQPSSPLISKSEAQRSTEAKSFRLDFENGTLPNNMVIGQNLLNGALKDGREYSVVTVPYTVYTKQNESTLLFTRSNLSAIFKTSGYLSPNTALLNTSEPAELALAIALGVALPLVVLGYLSCFGILVCCVLRRRKKKKMKKKYSRRDIIHALALRRAQQEGIELPWYNHQAGDDNQGDLPWLDPFATQPRMSQSTSSQSEQDISSTAAQPSESLAMSSEPVLMEVMASTLNTTDLVSACRSQAMSIEAVHTDAYSSSDVHQGSNQSDCNDMSLRLEAEPDQETANVINDSDDHPSDYNTGGHTPSPEDASPEMNSYRISNSDDSDFRQDSSQSIDSEHLSLHQPALTDQCTHSSSVSSNCDDHSTCELGEEKTHTGDASLELNYTLSTNSNDSSKYELGVLKSLPGALPGDISVETNGSFYSIRTSNTDDHTFSEDSTQFIDCEHLSPFQRDSTVKFIHSSSNCDEHNTYDVAERSSLPGDALLEMNRSFHCSKPSEKENSGSSDSQDSIQSTAVDYELLSQQEAISMAQSMHRSPSSSNCEDHHTDDEKIVDEDKLVPEDATSAVNNLPDSHQESTQSTEIDREHLSQQEVISTAQSMHSTSNCDGDRTYEIVSENKLVPEDAASEMKNSLDYCQENTQSTNYEYPSLQMVQCDDLSYCESNSEKPLPGDVSLELNSSSCCSSTSKEVNVCSLDFDQNRIKSTAVDYEDLSPHEVASPLHCVQSGEMSPLQLLLTAQCVLSTDFGEQDPLLGCTSLELNYSRSNISSACSNHDYKLINYSSSNDHLNITPPADFEYLSPPNTSRSGNSDDHSSSDLGEEESHPGYTSLEVNNFTDFQLDSICIQPADYEYLSLCQVTPTSPYKNSGSDSKSSNFDAYSVYDLGEKQPLPGDASLELNYSKSTSCGSHDLPVCKPLTGDASIELGSHQGSTKSSSGDHSSSDDYQNSISSTNREYLSPHQVMSTDQYVQCSSNCNDLTTYGLLEKNPLPGDVSLEQNASFYSSGTINTDSDHSSSNFHQDSTQSGDREHLSTNDIASYYAQCVLSSSGQSIYKGGSAYDLNEEIPIPRDTSRDLNQLFHISISNSTFASHSSYDLDAQRPLPGDDSLELENSFYSIRKSNTDDCSSSDDCQDAVLFTNPEHLSSHQGGATAQYVHSSSKCDDHSTCDLDEEQLPSGDASLELNFSISINPNDCSNHDIGVHTPLPRDTYLEMNDSFYSSRIRYGIDQSFSDFCQDSTQSSDREHLSLHQVVSSAPREHSGLQLSPVGSVVSTDDEVCIVMDDENSPHGCDEQTDIVATGCLSQNDIENILDTGHSTALTSSISYSEYIGSVCVGMDIRDGTHLLKLSRSAPLLTSRESSNGPLDNNNDNCTLITPRRVTSQSILEQLTELGANEGEHGIVFHQDSSHFIAAAHEHLSEASTPQSTHSALQLSPVGSVISTDDEVCIVMETDNEDIPLGCDDNDSNEAVTVTHYAMESPSNTSNEYFTASSEFSSGHLSQGGSESTHSTGHSPDISSGNSGSEYKDSVHFNRESTGTHLLKVSSSASLFIPRGLSHELQDNYHKLVNTFPRHNSTLTSHSILEQLTESSASEGEHGIAFHQDSNQFAAADDELLSLSPMGQRTHRGLQLSPVGSVISTDDEVRIVMELENENFPPGCYDKESPEIITATETPLYTKESSSNTSTEYFTAPSGNSSGHLCQRGDGNTHSCGAGHSLVKSSSSSDSEYEGSVHIDMDPTHGTHLLKTSSSASLFIPRGLSSELQDSLNTSQRRSSTVTSNSILEQFTESSASEREQRTVNPIPDQPSPIYEPY